MGAVLKRRSQLLDSPRARERVALHELDDGHVVQQHFAGDPQAFGALVDRYQTRLLTFVHRTIGDRERAEDLVQEVFIRVFRHLHRFDQTKKFSTWIYTIASNLAKNELRNRSRNPLVLFQTIKTHWESDHRPLQFEDTTARPDDQYRRRYLPFLARAVARGHASAADLAHLHDRVSVDRCRPQAFGTQSLALPGSPRRLWPTEHGVNIRRAAAGLPGLSAAELAAIWAPGDLRRLGIITRARCC